MVSLLFSQPLDISRIKIIPLVSRGIAKMEKQYVAGQLIVKMSPAFFHGNKLSAKVEDQGSRQLALRKLTAQFRGLVKRIRLHAPTGLYVAETEAGVTETEVRDELLLDPRIEKAALNYYAYVSTVIPNDPFFKYQYGLQNTGQVYLPDYGLSGKSGSDIAAVLGWDWGTGKEDMIVAVLDTGVAADHIDLAGKVLPGYNFISDSENTDDDYGHGTFVASIAAANTNDGIGMAGVCWQAKILPVKVMDSSGRGDFLSIGAGLKYAADQGARVINMSFGAFSSSFVLQDFCQYAFQKGCVLVAAAGNEDSAVNYPAAYDNYCLAVGATNANDTRVSNSSWGSNFGSELDVVAPGEWVFGAAFDPEKADELDWYQWAGGTSAATPIVAGAAALLLSNKPMLTNQQVMDLVRFTADDVNQDQHPGIDDFLGYGRLNLKRLLGPYILE